MTDFSQFFQQIGNAVDQLVGKDTTVSIVTIAAISAMGTGLIVAVLGARLWRFTLTAAFILIGAGVGAQVASSFNWMPLAGMAIGAAGIGMIAFKLYRIWVGIAAAAFFAVAAGSAVGYHDMVPQLRQFGPPPAVSPNLTAGSANVADNDDERMAMAKRWWSQQGPALDNWAQGFWAQATSQNQNVKRNFTISAAAAGIFGLILGIFSVRFTSVVITTVTGTVLLVGGASALVKAWKPEMFDNAFQHPNVIGTALGVFLLASFVLQMLLTRSDKPAKSAPEASG